VAFRLLLGVMESPNWPGGDPHRLAGPAGGGPRARQRHFHQRHQRRRAHRAREAAASVLMGLSALAPFVDSLDGAVAALVVVNFGIGAWISIYLTMAQEVSPQNVSTAAGLLGGSGSLAGAAVSRRQAAPRAIILPGRL
jgi:hypothetical protein